MSLSKYLKSGMIAVFLFMGSIMIFGGCTENFEELNTNPTLLTSLDPLSIGSAYAGSQYHGMLGNSGNYQIMQSLFADLYSQYFANVATYFSSDRYVLIGNWLNGGWSYYYRTALSPLLIVLQNTEPESGEYALAQIWKVQIFHRITDQWGPVPYFQFGNGNKSVAYDPQQSIYRDFFLTLDSATQVLDKLRGQNIFGAHDQIYQGDVDRWIVFASTLRLRLALRISGVDPDLAQEQAEKSIGHGVMESNEDAASLQVGQNSPNNLTGITAWNEFRMSASMESYLKGYRDPRLSEYFSPVAGTDSIFKGVHNGLDPAEQAMEPNSPSANSNMHARWLEGANFETPIPVIRAAEAFFLRAEGALKGWNMGGSAKDFYNKGIQLSLEDYGVAMENIADYLGSTNLPSGLNDYLNTGPVADIPVKFDENDPQKALQQVLTQKWLALYPDGIEAWSELRRSGYPKVYPRVHSENPDVPENLIIRRLAYVSSEYNQNLPALEQGIKLLGGPDNGGVQLWWDLE